MAAHLSEQRDLELRGCVEHLKAEHEIGAGLRAHQQRKLRSQIRAEKHGTQAGTQVEQRTRHIVARTVLTPAAAEWKPVPQIGNVPVGIAGYEALRGAVPFW